jgi:hypothetical protein
MNSLLYKKTAIHFDSRFTKSRNYETKLKERHFKS